ncbi:arrestin [Xylaria sp. CBS 124048]|nr:arrestin [Xylaria sp. CBS 124048]
MALHAWPAHSASSILGEPTRKHAPSKVEMEVHIDGHHQFKIYTTASSVTGHVVVKTSQDINLKEIRINLLGNCKTRVDTVNLPQSTAKIFLNLTMPVPESCYPESRCYKAGVTYAIPFHFIIPRHLTLNACHHYVSSDSVREDHLRLPPSVGDWVKGDFAPQMTRIRYSVLAKAYYEHPDGKDTKAAEASRDIKVIPITPEKAPLNITAQDKLYTMAKSKSLRKSILSPRLGTVTVSASQPRSVMMDIDGHSTTPTTAHLDLVFVPASVESQPPRIIGVASKVTAVSYYSANKICQYPNHREWDRTFGIEGAGSYSSSVPLPVAPVESAAWEQHLTTQPRRDSGYHSGHQSESDHAVTDRETLPPGQKRSHKGAPYYYATKVRVPIEIPAAKKQFIPTFHSCNASRVYVLLMAVTLSTLAGKTLTISVGVPLQIGVGSRGGPRADATGLPTFEAAMEENDTAAGLEVDAYLRSRTMSVPDIEFHSVLPGYSSSRNRPAP